MSENKGRKMVPHDPGFFQGLTLQAKLILRLMGDPRVSAFIKLLPVGSLLYFLIPDLIVGPIDDALIVWLGSYLFVEMCPPGVVEEHRNTIQAELNPGTWHDPDIISPQRPDEPPAQASAQVPADGRDDVIDGDFREM